MNTLPEVIQLDICRMAHQLSFAPILNIIKMCPINNDDFDHYKREPALIKYIPKVYSLLIRAIGNVDWSYNRDSIPDNDEFDTNLKQLTHKGITIIDKNDSYLNEHFMSVPVAVFLEKTINSGIKIIEFRESSDICNSDLTIAFEVS